MEECCPSIVVVVQSLSRVRLFETPWIEAHRLPCPSLFPEFTQTHVHWGCDPTIASLVALFSSCLHSFSASGSFPVSWLFTSGSQSIGASASAPVLPVKIQLISCRTDWFDPLAVQGTLKSLLQHHSSKASILWHSAFFMVQLSYP